MNKFMKIAKESAENGMILNEGGPFGAVITDKDSNIISVGNNQVLKNNDPTAHAEVIAIRNACKKLNTYDLSNCILYTSCEPCPMCLSAAIWANIKDIYYACTREDAANIGFRDDIIYKYLEGKNKDLIKYRRNDIGFVFQFYNLVQNLTAQENVELATEICKNSLNPTEVLKKVGLKDRLNNFPSQLSGGEQQRVAIARAIAKNPKLLLCDEPTGALDYKTGKQILKLLQDTARKENMTVLIITHNGALAPMADKVIHFKNGTAEDIIINNNPVSVEEIEW